MPFRALEAPLPIHPCLVTCGLCFGTRVPAITMEPLPSKVESLRVQLETVLDSKLSSRTNLSHVSCVLYVTGFSSCHHAGVTERHPPSNARRLRCRGFAVSVPGQCLSACLSACLPLTAIPELSRYSMATARPSKLSQGVNFKCQISIDFSYPPSRFLTSVANSRTDMVMKRTSESQGT